MSNVFGTFKRFFAAQKFRRLETIFFPAGTREQVVRAEKVLMHAPALIRAGGETAREQLSFFFAQAWSTSNFSQNSANFFIHNPILLAANAWSSLNLAALPKAGLVNFRIEIGADGHYKSVVSRCSFSLLHGASRPHRAREENHLQAPLYVDFPVIGSATIRGMLFASKISI